MFQGLGVGDWLPFWGALVGPFLAVLVTRLVDILRDKQERRNAVFVALMTTRRAQLNADHVNAVNRIEIEFANVPSVISALRAYMTLLEEPIPPTPDGKDLLLRRRRRAFGSLVQAIGAKLGRRIDRYDIVEGGYYPGGWEEAESLQLDNMRQINALLHFKRPLGILQWGPAGIPQQQQPSLNTTQPPPPNPPTQPPPNSPFPPRP